MQQTDETSTPLEPRYDVLVVPADPRVRIADGGVRAILRYLVGTQVAQPYDERSGAGWHEILLRPAAFGHQLFVTGEWPHAHPPFAEGSHRFGRPEPGSEPEVFFKLELRGCLHGELRRIYMQRFAKALPFAASVIVRDRGGEGSEDG